VKELIEKILSYIPKYMLEFGALFTRPKIFIAERNTLLESTFVDCLLFLGISVVLSTIMSTSLPGSREDIWSSLAGTSVSCAILIVGSGLALRLAWRIVGGRAATRSFIVVYAYLSGVQLIIFSIPLKRKTLIII